MRVPTRARLDTLGRVMERAFSDALAQTERYRTWLLYYSAFLLALLGLAAIQLRRANRSLERRVTERTKELSSTLGRLKDCRELRILVAHGEWNARAPIDRARRDVAALRAGGLRVAFHAYPCAHRLTAPLLNDVDTWLINQCTAGL